MSKIGAVLDAAALFPASLRDILLRNAASGLYRVYWSGEIIEELRRNLLSHKKMTEAQAQYLVDKISEYFPEAIVEPATYQSIISLMQNDPKDRHVLAAAVAVGAEVIVTPNIKDFPKKILSKLNIEAQTPDTFLIYQFASDPEQVALNIRQQARDLKNPPKSLEDVLGTLSLHAPNFVRILGKYYNQQQ